MQIRLTFLKHVLSGLLILLFSGGVYSQTCTPTVEVTPVTCFGSNEGSITVTETGCVSSGCYTDTPVPVETCTACTSSPEGSMDVVVSEGEKACIQSGTSLNGNIYLNGGSVVICGSATVGTLNLGANTTVVILGTATISNINFNSSTGRVYNYGMVTFQNNLPVAGEFHNYGVATVNYDLNVNDASGKVYNYKDLTVKGNLNNSEILENRGNITAGTNSSHRVHLNSTSQTLNACTMSSVGEFIVDASSKLNQQGELTTGTLTVNGSSYLNLEGGRRITTQNFTGNTATIRLQGGSGCGLLEVTGNTTFNSGLVIDGEISYCDANGIETTNANVTLLNGAGLNCICDPVPAGSAQISWPDLGLTGPEVSGLGAGTYTLELTCGSCSYTDSIEIAQPAALAATVVAHANGSVELEVTGGTIPYTFQWVHGGLLVSTEEDPANLPVGLNTVTVTDANGCTTETSVDVPVAECETTESVVAIKPETCAGASDGSITIEINDNFCTPDGDGGNCFTGPAVPPVSSCTECQTYSGETITDGQQFCISDSYNGTINMTGGRLVICGTATATGVTLSGNAEIIILGSFAGSNMNFNSTTVHVANYGNLLISGSEPIGGTFNNYGKATVGGDWNINSGGNLIVFNNYDTLQVTGSLNNSKNFNNYGTINVATHFQQNSGGVFANYCTMTVQGNILINAEVRNQGKLLNHFSGSTATVNSGGKLVMIGGLLETTALQVNDLISSGSEIYCSLIRYETELTNSGGSVTGVELCAYGNSCSCTTAGSGKAQAPAFTWEGPGVDGQTGSSLRDLSPGDYTVTIGCGSCIVKRTYTIQTLTPITVTTIGTPVTCDDAFDGTVRAEVTGGSGAYTFEWGDGFKTIGATAQLSNLLTGVYTVTVRDSANDFCSVERSITLSEKGAQCPCGNIEISFDGDIPTCGGGMNGSLRAEASGGIGPYHYTWNTGATGPTITSLGAGWYGVMVTDALGNTCQRKVFLNQPTGITVDIEASSEVICEGQGELIVLTAVTGPGARFSWSPGGATTKEITVSASGTYTVTATNSLGCQQSAHITLNADRNCIPCNFQVELNPNDISCYGLSDGRVTATVDGGSGNYRYAWSNSSTSRVVRNLNAGTYTVSVRDVETNSVCSGNMATVNEPDPLQIAITGSDIVCQESSTTLTATGSSGTYRWLNRSETTQSITVTQGGTYRVEVSQGSCVKLSEPFRVLKQPSRVFISGNRTEFCPGESAVLVSSFPYGTVWSTGETTRSISVSEPGTYTLTVRLGNCVGASSDFTVNELSAEACTPKPCEPSFSVPVDIGNPCAQMELDLAVHNARLRYTRYLKEQQRDFQQRYIARCMKVQEDFTVEFTEKEHHYTLYYYDQAGNLTRTVPPQGVKVITDPTKLAAIKEARKTKSARTASLETEHDYATTYTYNSLNQPVAQKLPDHGTQDGDTLSSRFWYDELGRLVLSQTARQYHETPSRYSYSLYDYLNRVIETGEVRGAVDLDTIVNRENPVQVITGNFKEWIAGEIKHEVTRTYYDQNNFTALGITQENLRNRVASSTYEVADTDKDISTYDHATHYSYDIHGNVKILVQDNPELDHLPRQRYKRIDYLYDLISGNVLEVQYQKGQPDQFFHKYRYDADNRLSEVVTSSDYIHWDRDAKQKYYQHGALARLELGEEKVQGMDYAYTIQGWLKGVNSNTLVADRDMGKDGQSGSVNNLVPPDQIGYSLGYFRGDYNAISDPVTNDQFLANLSGSELETANKDVYNGNISHMITSIGEFMKEGQGPLAMSFSYDQLNRIKGVNAFQDGNLQSSNSWSEGGTSTQKYSTRYEYDANGNILKLKRNANEGTTAESNGMDDLNYIYENLANGYPANTNKLVAVQDQRAHTQEIDDIKPGQTFNPADRTVDNYQYDPEGRLTADLSEGIIRIEWNSQSKVTKITRADTSKASDMEFGYDAQGRRILKLVKPRDGNGLLPESEWSYTHYVLDAQGNTMGVYTRKYKEQSTTGSYQEQLAISEQHLFGSDRLGYQMPTKGELVRRSFTADIGTSGHFVNITEQGILIPSVTNEPISSSRGNKVYELQNHLGNMLTVVSDRRNQISENASSISGYTADVVSASDYYPFGMMLPGRVFSSFMYRYGFNGMEKDDEVKGEGNSYTSFFRQYDPRLGKWLSIDPEFRKYAGSSPYLAFNNSPILFNDPMGDDPMPRNFVPVESIVPIRNKNGSDPKAPKEGQYRGVTKHHREEAKRLKDTYNPNAPYEVDVGHRTPLAHTAPGEDMKLRAEPRGSNRSDGRSIAKSNEVRKEKGLYVRPNAKTSSPKIKPSKATSVAGDATKKVMKKVPVIGAIVEIATAPGDKTVTEAVIEAGVGEVPILGQAKDAFEISYDVTTTVLENSPARVQNAVAEGAASAAKAVGIDLDRDAEIIEKITVKDVVKSAAKGIVDDISSFFD